MIRDFLTVMQAYWMLWAWLGIVGVCWLAHEMLNAPVADGPAGADAPGAGRDAMTVRKNGKALYQIELSPDVMASLEAEAKRQRVTTAKLVRFALASLMAAAPCDRDVRQHPGKFRPAPGPLDSALEDFAAYHREVSGV